MIPSPRPTNHTITRECIACRRVFVAPEPHYTHCRACWRPIQVQRQKKPRQLALFAQGGRA